MKLQIKRAYQPASPADGERILVDRLWPRGLKKDSLALTSWLKDVAPSNDLRHWFGHDPARWGEFRRRYQAELKARPEALRPLWEALARGPVTLLYSAHDKTHNQAVAFREYLVKSKKNRLWADLTPNLTPMPER